MGAPRCSLPLGLQLFGLPSSELIGAPALHVGIEHFQGSAAGVDLVVMGEIGEAFEDAEQVLVPKAARHLHVAARHCALNGPNLVSLSPLSAAGVTVKLLIARTRWSAWLLPACPGSTLPGS